MLAQEKGPDPWGNGMFTRPSQDRRIPLAASHSVSQSRSAELYAEGGSRNTSGGEEGAPRNASRRD
ncbi:hypothetical protein GCM10009788_59210 [Nocardioides humi]|uniref:Uncharacterized protein n=1 Tax=Nocardioides humi TaxID=449461 RepID=A0ABN2C154_9ACTN